ncbi:pentapeptide repeat-containing protein [Phytomonospora sp. NPDC050363]|uniref:pentapeptide repeat-containing protein n=1 Tax=Phytomonospora sp. NPDC050363 TaxID=3155642 RepID=UPI0033CB40B1
MRPPEHAVAIVLNVDGRQTGLGFLIGPKELVTCAHVVNTAIGRKRSDRSPPDGPLRVRFPFAAGKGEVTATVSAWFRSDEPGGDADLAILALPPGATEGIEPLALADRADSGIDVQMCGPSTHGLQHVRGLLVGQAGLGRLQIDQNRGGAFRVASGFSGGPVWRQSTGEVVGVMRAASLDEDASAAECIDIAVLHRLRSGRRHAPDRPSPGARSPIVLQLGGTRFTRHDRGAASLLAEAILADLARLEHEHRLRPNLLVVAGDLTEGARPPEFDVAALFLNRITETLDIGAERIVLVPGRSDVNTRLCEAYFAQCAEYDEEPIAPYWDKWGPYSALLERLTGRPLSRAEPWRAHELARPPVSVTALNSTFGQSHLPDSTEGYYGEAQLRWMAAQSQDARRAAHVVVSHHALLSAPPSRDPEIQRAARTVQAGADLILAAEADPRVPPLAHNGRAPVLTVAGRDRYHLVHIQPGDIEIYARRRDAGTGRFVGDTGIDPDGDDWRLRLTRPVTGQTAPPQPPAADPKPPSRLTENLRLVQEASQLRDPDALFHPHEPGDSNGFAYLRAIRRHDFGDGLEPAGEYLIGVLNGPPDRADLDRFRTEVIDLFRSPGSPPPARLVYFGQLAEVTVAAYAQRLGIHVESFQRFQRGWDPRRFVAWQEVDLASDRRYPPQLYIPQGFQELGPRGIAVDELGRDSDADRQGLPERVASWLREPYGHLIVVLGAAGSGKTFFLRTLARELSHVDSPVTPIYLPVRDLDRLPEIDEVVAAYLTRAGEERLNPTRFNYLLKEGRIALLLDGLDELTAQSSYERAIGHLREIGSKAERLAKIVVTARDVEFLSNSAVLDALGGTSAVTEGRRALRIAEFSSAQIEEFLTRLLGSEEDARRRIELLGGLGQLPEVARNPRMLSFIAEIGEERLMQARADGEGRLTGADLYRQVLDQWITGELARLTRPSQLPPLNAAELWQAVRTLALHLWRTDREHATIDDLGLAAAALSKLDDDPLAGPPPEADVRVHQLGAGSLLVRHEDGELGFIHRSIREWLVAQALSPLPAHDPSAPLSMHRVTSQTASFLCEINGRRAVWAWIDGLTAVPGATAIAQDNALALQRFVGRRPPTNRSRPPGGGAPAVGDPHDLTTLYLGADMRLYDLRNRQLTNHDFTGAKLQRADMSGNDLTGVRFTRVNLGGAQLVGAKLTDASLVEADATGANFNGADLSRTLLDRARLWRASLLGTKVEPAALAKADTTGAATPTTPMTVQLRASKVGEIAAVEPNNQLVVSGDKHGWLHLWDLETGTPVRQWKALRGPIRSLCWSPDGRRVLAGGDGASISNTLCGEVDVSWGESEMVAAVAWSPQADRIATAHPQGTVSVRSADSGEALQVVRPLTKARTLAWSPDGAHLAVGGDNSFVVIEPGESEALARCETLSETRVLAWSPDGHHIASGHADGTVETWSTTRYTSEDTVHAHPSAVRALAWSPDGTGLFSGGEDGWARRWHVWKLREAGSVEHSSSAIRSKVRSLGLSPDGTRLVTAGGADGIRAWTLGEPPKQAWQRRDKAEGATAARPDWIRTASWSPDGRHIVSGSEGGELRIWSLDSGGTIRKRYQHPQAILSADWSGDGTKLATGSNDGVIALWQHTLKPEPSWTGGAWVRAVRWSPDGSLLASGSDDEYVHVWVASRRDPVHRWRLGGRVRDLVWSLDGQRVFAAGSAGAIGCWNAENGRNVWRKSTMEHTIWALCVTETLVLTGDSARTLRLHSAGDGTEIAAWEAHNGSVTAIAWNQWEHQIISAGTDGHVRIWDPNTHGVICEWLAHAGWITSLSLSPDGAHLLTSGDDNVLRIWRARTGEPVATLVPLSNGREAVLYGDGLTYKLNGNADGRFWYAAAQVRFEPTEADEYVPDLVRVAENHPIL